MIGVLSPNAIAEVIASRTPDAIGIAMSPLDPNAPSVAHLIIAGEMATVWMR